MSSSLLQSITHAATENREQTASLHITVFSYISPGDYNKHSRSPVLTIKTPSSLTLQNVKITEGCSVLNFCLWGKMHLLFTCVHTMTMAASSVSFHIFPCAFCVCLEDFKVSPLYDMQISSNFFFNTFFKTIAEVIWYCLLTCSYCSQALCCVCDQWNTLWKQYYH